MSQSKESIQQYELLKQQLHKKIPNFKNIGLDAALQHFFKENSDQLDSSVDVQNFAPILEIMLENFIVRNDDHSSISFLDKMVTSESEEFQPLLIIDKNRPFIVETIQMQLEKVRSSVLWSFNALFVVQRSAGGDLQHIHPYEGQNFTEWERVESLNLYILHNVLDSDGKDSLLKILQRCFVDIANADHDWSAMTSNALGLSKTIRNANFTSNGQGKYEADFIEWLVDSRFTFLGMRQTNYEMNDEGFSVAIDHKMSQGILRDHTYQVFEGVANKNHMIACFRDTLKDTDQAMYIFKTSLHSPIRRDTPMDAILIKRYDQKGNCTGDTLFVGLFAWAVYAVPLAQIPLAKEKLDAIMEHFNATMRSYRGRQIMHFVENYSRDLLFQIDIDTLIRHVETIRRGNRRREFVALDFRSDFSLSQYVSVILPRGNYSALLRERMLKFLKDYCQPVDISYSVHLPDAPMWRVDFRLFFSKNTAMPNTKAMAEIHEQLSEMSQSTEDRLRAVLALRFGSQKVSALVLKYSRSFGADYWSRNDAEAALFDIQSLELMTQNKQQIQAKLYNDAGSWQVRLYNTGKHKIYLSEIMPMLERMGLEVRTEEPFALNVTELDNCGLFVFTVSHSELDDKDDVSEENLDNFSECLSALFEKKTESDLFLSLVLRAGLTWRNVVILRAYAKYLRQIGATNTERFISDTLLQNAHLARNLVRLFSVRFDPQEKDEDAEALILVNVKSCMDNVENVDQDRILNRYLQLIQATLRTNFYQDNGSKEAVSFKLAPRDIAGMPNPVPLREIFVYSPNFEAVHLRFGMVARGGLRWSDRQEDFRTEVLGLVKAQQVKNAVIVPMGSKGGFVLKNAQPDRQAFMAEGVKRYKEFIASMLDITDSYTEDGTIRKPQDVVCHDGDDPYLVVAADKGTATFSDFANEISNKANFWLGDAFASGGSVGYDHKKMGITARGAWESVKRHFRELGHNTQTTPFEVVGVGDMSGDVFGNGMLLSEHIKLIGAFNHMHIFVDPNPDPKSSFAERQRLFNLSRSGWTDYNQELMSKGGMIYDRNVKTLKLTLEIKEKLAFDRDEVSPNELMMRLLTMSSDLLWFGGIGTYIKSAQENNIEVGDKANDAIRVNGADIGARVIGEGANLGATQLGRIEYCAAGGRSNTDAIDNSAGVDCSDHEVNIKILLSSALSSGNLAQEEREALLESMTDEVGLLVLKNNYAQTQSLSVTEMSSAKSLDMHQRLIQSLERMGELDRQLEGLPNDEEIERRRINGTGLLRPELSVLIAYGKNIVYQNLQKSSMMAEPILQKYLIDYFPKTLQQRFPKEIINHQLSGEIVATVITNMVINRSGVGFISEMNAITGAQLDQICMAYLAVCEVFSLQDIWMETEALDNVVSTSMQHKIFTETTFTIYRMTEWMLRNAPQPFNVDQVTTYFGSGLQELRKIIHEIMSPSAYGLVEKRIARFQQKNVPESLAQKVGHLKVLSSACDIVNLSHNCHSKIEDAAKCYFAVSDRFALDRLRSLANEIQANDVWTSQALSALIDDLWELQFKISSQTLKSKGGLDSWLADRSDKLVILDNQFSELFQRKQIDVAVLSVIQRQIRMLL